ncbi:MAG: hypothetical protein ACYC7A_14165 [Thermoanaerobaculia bacterium]
MWYNTRPMTGRALAFVLLALVAFQLAGGIAAPAVCAEPCPDDDDGSNCPPVCSLCSRCTHAQIAIAHPGIQHSPLSVDEPVVPQATISFTSNATGEIFHVPISG